MKTSPNGQAFIRKWESCRLRAYPDPQTGGLPWTIGWGATGPGITQSTIWSQEQADSRFTRDLAEREDDMTHALLVPVNQGQFDALVSILFNVGHGSPIKDGIIRLKSNYPSTLLRRLNEANYTAARTEFSRWISPGTTSTKGLQRRRRAEQAVWDGASFEDAYRTGMEEFP